MNAASDRVPEGRPLGETVAGAAWTVLIGVTALGHVTALRNTLTVLVALATLVLYRRSIGALPARAAVAALFVWAVASTSWSPAPLVTLGKLRTDLLIPLVAGAGAFCFAREGRGLPHVLRGFVLGLALLAALSLFAYFPAGWAPATWVLEQSGGIVRPLPRWYPGPGDASMFAILSIAPLTLAWRTSGERTPWRRAGIAAGAMLIAFVLVTTNNRNAVLVAPLVVVFQWALDRRVATGALDRAAGAAAPRRRGRAAAVAVVAAVFAVCALGATLEYGARERLAYLKRPMAGDSAAIELVATDTRPMIWRYYLARGLEHPWIGMGFGRTVPGIGWKTESDRSLQAIEPNAYIHAHNLALNWWLQLGVVGLVLAVVALSAAVRAARRAVEAAGRTAGARLANHAFLASGVAVAARNTTDDFIVYGLATAAFVVAGALLGELSRMAAAAVPEPRPGTFDVEESAVSRRLQAGDTEGRDDGAGVGAPPFTSPRTPSAPS